ncbi:calmodulin-like protein 8 isoform X2 [Argonauta hians]
MSLTKQEWEVMFNELDVGGDGYLSVDELQIGLKKRNINVSKAAVQSALKSLDVDSDGKVTKAEFVQVMSKPCIQDPNEMKKAFNMFDTDGSGYITKDELKKAMKSLGMDCSSEEIERIMRSVSKDDDKIDYNEFVQSL